MRVRITFVGAAIWVFVLDNSPPSAHACACVELSEFGFITTAKTVPADYPGPVWQGKRYGVQFEIVESRRPKATPRPVPSSVRRIGSSNLWLVAPQGGFKPGWHYEVRAQTPFQLAGLRALRFEVEAKPLAKRGVARLAISPLRSQQIYSGVGAGCEELSATVKARDIQMQLPASFRRYAKLFFYQTFFDGQSWQPPRTACRPRASGTGIIARGKERIFTACTKGQPAIRRVRVHMTATLPGTQLAIRTPAVTLAIPCSRR